MSLVFILLLLVPKFLPCMEENQSLATEVAQGEAVTSLDLTRIAHRTQPVVIGRTKPHVDPPGGLLQRLRRRRWLHAFDQWPVTRHAQHEQTCVRMGAPLGGRGESTSLYYRGANVSGFGDINAPHERH